MINSIKQSGERLSLACLLIQVFLYAETLSAGQQNPSTKQGFISASTVGLSFRLRHELVDQDGLSEDAKANTVRTRVSWQSGTSSNISAKIEFDDVRSIGDDNYNSTSNGNTQYPVIADPEGSEINQAFIQYKDKLFSAILGRQGIKLDDQRFVGTVGWRQNEQTYDALRLKYLGDSKQFDYSYIDNVNRIFGPDGDKANLKAQSHLFNAKFTLTENQQLALFNYYLDFDLSAALSNNSYGLRYAGKHKSLSITASYAQQTDASSNPTSYSADYWMLEASGKTGIVKWKIGQETLGSDNGKKAFTTPLATLHKFQGFADKFLGTPNNGVEDRCMGFGSKLSDIAINVSYHQLTSEYGNDSLGDEWNASAAYTFNKHFNGLLKYADYNSDSHATDTRKLWLQLLISI
ncbi:alginate export family protein [uncultured Pseudoteredinibacter sp.]|uniref:alginate export family protein n=1 Tax=uncultured Pseudoteredinibacter sp. TaxID=1641701 RepID=UPI002623497C|nr:alginate export family protein [uncultured Pseudoteredinibacter sp.]